MHAKNGVWGEGVQVERVVETTDEAMERARDLSMLRLSDSGLTYRQIGIYLNTSASTVCRRLKRIPPDARTYYAKQSVVGLG